MTASTHREYPHLDRKWADAATRELVARGADGRAIGDALATADTHCADSGENANDAFGDPRTYAESIALSSHSLEQRALRNQVKAAWPSLIGLAGMFLTFRVVDTHLNHSTSVPIRVGDLVALVGIVALSIALIHRIDLLMHHPVVSWIVASAVFTGIIAAQILLTSALGHAHILVAAVIAAALLIGCGVWGTLTAGTAPDPVTDPRPGSRLARPGKRFKLVTAWLLPALTVIFGGVILLVG